jgi:hypothetical protein
MPTVLIFILISRTSAHPTNRLKKVWKYPAHDILRSFLFTLFINHDFRITYYHGEVPFIWVLQNNYHSGNAYNKNHILDLNL